MDSGWTMNGVPVPLDDCYTDTVTHLRIFDEGDGWALDAADDEGRYSLVIWKFDSHEDAVANMGEFVEFLATEGYTIDWRSRGMGLC
jgi:hypothetical protein